MKNTFLFFFFFLFTFVSQSERPIFEISLIYYTTSKISFHWRTFSINVLLLSSQIHLKTTFEYILFWAERITENYLHQRLLFFSQVKVLTDIGFFTEAFHELALLNCGERIPWKIPAGYRKIEQMKVNSIKV